MGFFHQLRLLLWKNFTLKKRSPLVVVFEMFIPLVLFVILLLIREKLPASKMSIARNHVRALPSTGMLSLIQLFCEGEGELDQQGFLNFSSENQLSRLLEQLQIVAQDHDYFRPGISPQEMDDLPETYQAVIDDPAFMIDALKNASDISFSSLLKDTGHFRKFLINNLSLPQEEADTLINSTIHVREIYHYIFGGKIGLNLQVPFLRYRRSSDNSYPSADLLSSFLNNSNNVMLLPAFLSLLPSSNGTSSLLLDLLKNMHTSDLVGLLQEATAAGGAGQQLYWITVLQKLIQQMGDGSVQELMPILQDILADPSKLSTKEGLQVVNHILQRIEAANGSIIIQPDLIASALKFILGSPWVMRKFLCDNDTFVDVIIPPNSTNQSVVEDLHFRLCHLTDAKLQELSHELSEEITNEKLIELLKLEPVNITATAYKLGSFLNKAERFMKFQRELEEIAQLISLLPFDDNATDIMNATVTTPPTDNSTDSDADHEHSSSGDERRKNSGWMKMWDMMHKTVCGKKTPVPPTKPPPHKHRTTQKTHGASDGGSSDDDADDDATADDTSEEDKQIDADALGMTQAQRDKLSIIQHYLYYNPTVLYAPNGTAADKIIQKANTTVAFIDLISSYAREWLNISQRLHAYLEKDKTEHNLEMMRKMQQDIRDHSSILSWLFQLNNLTSFLDAEIHTSEYYTHELNLIDAAASGWLRMMKGINLNIFRGFATEEDMLNYFLTQAYYDNASIIAGVVFQDLPDDGTIPPHLHYKIRQNATYLPSTKQVRKPTWVPGPGQNFYPYYQFGFVWVQDMIERAIIDLQVGRDVVEPGSYIQQFPYPCYVWDQFMFMIEHVMPLCLTFSWVYSVAMLVQSIVYEKEQRLKEVMKMMGLSNAVHWCAWFVTTFSHMTISVVLLSVLLKMGNVLPHSDFFIIFLVMEIYICAIISFSFLISVLYSKAKVAAACAGIIYFLSYVPYMYIAIKEDIAGDNISGVWKTLASLFSTTAFGLGAKYFAFYEEMGVGVQWSNIYISPAEHDEFNLFLVTLMMVIDCFIYGVLVWYIEHVHPGSYGLPKPWYFPLMKSYWCGGNRHVEHCGNPLTWCFRGTHDHLSVTEEDQACAMAHQNPEHAHRFEPDPVHLPLGVCIDHLTKVYKLGKKTAVKNLSLNLYEDQITSFLGHNGAGKTTTMSMITGLIPPTAGTASVYNYDIRTDMDVIRQSLGMCPQHNVLFEKFTVEEHLWFYASLKGMKADAIKKETDRMIEDLCLPDKRHVRVDCLSGGMQRKLSVAIAFVGGSRTVILDEPTAGVDPFARRAIWDLLVKFKKGRTILLSTHHMDEADFLGDRIAIISNGQLKCVGSSIFLKNMIGDGYHLTFSKAELEVHEEEEEGENDDNTEAAGDTTHEHRGMPARASTQSGHSHSHHHSLHQQHHQKQKSLCKESQVTAFVQKYVSSAYLVSENFRELHYILPFEEVKKGCFEKLFTNLDTSLDELHVTSYGIMDTNLEEIFLKVTEAAYIEEEATEETKSLETFPPDRAANPSHTHPSSAGTPLVDSPATSLSNLLDSDMGGLAAAAPTAYSADRNNASTEEGSSGSEEGCESPGYHSSRVPILTRDNIILEDFSGDQLSWGRSGRDMNMINLVDIGSDRHVPQASVPGRHDTPRILLEGRGSHMLNSKLLLFNHFKAVIIKRFHYITRNWRSLFSQIILPAIFVAIAMTVALAAPSVDDLPPLELSTTQYTNVSLPKGNFIPFTNERMSRRSKVNPLDAIASELQETLALASGIGASCLLKSPNITVRNHSADYDMEDYEALCQWMFQAQSFLSIEHTKRYSEHYINMTFDPQNPYSSRQYYPSNCACKEDGTGFNCQGDPYEKPPGFQVVTLDRLNNITGQKTQDYLLYTTYDMEMHRYGGLSFGLVQKYVPENFGLNAPTLFKKLAVRNVATMWFNHKGYHSMAVYLNILNNAILRANLPPSKGNPAAYGFTLYNHPWNDTNSELSSLDYILEGSDVLISIFIIAAMSFVPASFVVFLVYEKSTKAKHLQFVTGMNPVMYWLGNYVWDMANYVIPAFMCVMILLIFQIPAYVSAANLPSVVALFLMYGWSMTPLMYPASFWFKEPSVAYIALIVINLFTGITCIVCSFLLEIFSYDHDLERVHKVLKVVFMMFPNYCLGRGLMELAFNEYKNEYYFKTGQIDKMRSAMEFDLIPCHLVAMASIGLIFFLITLMCEYRFFVRPRQSKVSQTPLTEDSDVAAERKRVLKGNGKYDMLVLENLTKVYKTQKLGRHLAVDRLCLGVPPGECFGLLGVNGAGKTTTFKMLTGDLKPTSGCAYLNGYSVLKDLKKVQQSIGYCPQFDSLYDELTAREHLQLYCRLRGIPPSDEKQVVEWALSKLGLSKYADKLSGTYSGGNKRKLSTAIALIGHPPLIFLDEPTTGMDPHSRRFLWDLILGLVQDGRSVVLTSHSMEECEALCSRMAIMVNGTFQCLGSSTHLKNRFGDGYTFTIRVKGPSYDRSRREVIRFVERNIPEAELKEQHYNIVQYELKTRPVSLAMLFSKLEEAGSNLSIEDYSVSQNTLDNVFINFVKQQTELVRDESEDTQRSRSLSSRLLTRASNLLNQSDEPLMMARNQSDDSLELSDDDILLTFNSDGNRLTLMPL